MLVRSVLGRTIVNIVKVWGSWRGSRNKGLRITVLPMSMFFDDAAAGKMTVRGNFAQVLYTEPSADDKGEPSPNQTIAEQDIIDEIAFQREVESLNIYDIPEMKYILLCKAMLAGFFRTRKFDINGNGLYQSKIQLALLPVPYPPEPSEQPASKES